MNIVNTNDVVTTSKDYLNKMDERTYDVYGPEEDAKISQRLKRVLSYYELRYVDLEAVLGVKRASVALLMCNHKTGNVYPRRNIHLYILAKYLNIDIQIFLDDDAFTAHVPSDEHIVSLLSKILTRFDMSQKRLTTLLGCRKGWIADMQYGTSTITISIVKNLIKCFGINYSDIFDQDAVDKMSLPNEDIITRVRELMWFHNISRIDLLKSTNLDLDEIDTLVLDTNALEKLAESLDTDCTYLTTGSGCVPWNPIDSYEKLCCYLRLCRKKRGLTTAQMANKCGWACDNAVCYIENPKHTCTTDTILKYFKGLEIDPSSVLAIDALYKGFSDSARIATYNTSAQKCMIGHRMRDARKIRNMSIRECAELAGVSESSWYNVENNRVYYSRLSVKKCSEILRVPVDWLLGGDNRPLVDVVDKHVEPYIPPTKNEVAQPKTVEPAEITPTEALPSIYNIIVNDLKEFSEADMIKIYTRMSETKRLNQYDELTKKGKI